MLSSGMRLGPYEIVQDAEHQGLHHLHLRLTDPARGLAWYADHFGGEQAKLKGQLDGLRDDGLWLLIDKADTPLAGSGGRAIDHLGWRVRDLAEAFAGDQAKGAKIAARSRSRVRPARRRAVETRPRRAQRERAIGRRTLPVR